MWLKGFLDGLSSSFPPPAETGETAASGVPVHIIWGSQTGTSESLAKKLAKQLDSRGHQTTIKDMADVKPSDLVSMTHLAIITSTYGDGEPPDNAANFHAVLHSGDAPPLSGVHFAILALGDSSYPAFCKCGHDFQTRLTALGASSLFGITEADVDIDEPFKTFAGRFEECLSALTPS